MRRRLIPLTKSLTYRLGPLTLTVNGFDHWSEYYYDLYYNREYIGMVDTEIANGQEYLHELYGASDEDYVSNPDSKEVS